MSDPKHISLRANAEVLSQFAQHCTYTEIVSATEKHYQFKIKRRAEKPPSALFSDDESKVYPFEDWAREQTLIQWVSKEGRYRLGWLENGVKVTIIVEE